MNLLQACEGVISNLVDGGPEDEGVAESDIVRWQHLFDFSKLEAVRQIREWRSDFGRHTIPLENWSVMKQQREESGYDKEAYEYAVATHRLQEPAQQAPQPSNVQKHDNLSASYLVRLEGPFADTETLKDIAGLSSLPEVFHGSSDNLANENDDTDDDSTDSSSGQSGSQFCSIDGTARHNLTQALADTTSSFKPTFIRDYRAKKELSPHSLYPTIGIDTTLPQFRPHRVDAAATFLPAQDQYPVWYFFYGTLADAPVLSQLLELPSNQPPIYRKAQIHGGRLRKPNRSWPYKGLVDAPQTDVVRGSAYLVKNSEEEKALRYYETEKYSVARCEIEFKDSDETVMGLTFKFVG